MQEPVLSKREYFVLELAKRMNWYNGSALSYHADKVVSFVDILLAKLAEKPANDPNDC